MNEEKKDQFGRLADILGIPYVDIDQKEFIRTMKIAEKLFSDSPELFDIARDFSRYFTEQASKTGLIQDKRSLVEKFEMIDSTSKFLLVVFGVVVGIYIGKRQKNPLDSEIWKW